MIQRIQTVYLMLAFALCVVCMCVSVGHFYTEEGERVGDLYNLWVHLADGHRSLKPWALFVLLLIPSTLIRPSIMAAIPFASIIFLYLAFRGIMKDEMLVRSLDRLRP